LQPVVPAATEALLPSKFVLQAADLDLASALRCKAFLHAYSFHFQFSCRFFPIPTFCLQSAMHSVHQAGSGARLRTPGGERRPHEQG
jgi:hypothetical protein